MTDIPPQVVDRGPNVSPYRARKPPEAVRVHLCGFDEGILVLRCHDLDVARDTLAAAIAAGDDLDRLIAYDRVDLDSPVPLWVRWVVDDPAEWPHGSGSWERELRGTIGATPAVLYASPDTTERIRP